jgi:hypothetical protein
MTQSKLMDELLQDQAEGLVESLGASLKIENLIFDDEDNTCVVPFDGKNLVTLTWLEEGRVIMIDEFITTLSPKDREDRHELIEKMLEANVFWMETQGATLSMHRESGTVIVARQLPVYGRDGVMIEAAALGNAIQDLVSLATKWRALLETGESNASLLQALNSDGNDAPEISYEQRMDAHAFNNPENFV